MPPINDPHWKLLLGLPGHGPVPLHYHLGHPTPWAEGIVIEFTSAEALGWIGNFQPHYLPGTQILEWSEANAFVVLAGGGFYLIDASRPDRYTSHVWVRDVLIAPERNVLIVCQEADLWAYSTDLELLWQVSVTYHIEVRDCSHGVLTLHVTDDLDKPYSILRLSLKDATPV